LVESQGSRTRPGLHADARFAGSVRMVTSIRLRKHWGIALISNDIQQKETT
jgi:hypothetical protein